MDNKIYVVFAIYDIQDVFFPFIVLYCKHQMVVLHHLLSAGHYSVVPNGTQYLSHFQATSFTAKWPVA